MHWHNFIKGQQWENTKQLSDNQKNKNKTISWLFFADILQTSFCFQKHQGDNTQLINSVSEHTTCDYGPPVGGGGVGGGRGHNLLYPSPHIPCRPVQYKKHLSKISFSRRTNTKRQKTILQPFYVTNFNHCTMGTRKPPKHFFTKPHQTYKTKPTNQTKHTKPTCTMT